MTNVRPAREILVSPAEQSIAPPDTPISPQTPDEGPPKADTFFSFARQHAVPALRCTVPVMIYAIATALPALGMFIPVLQEVMIPASRGNGTIASMSPPSAHVYVQFESVNSIYFMFLFLNIFTLSCIKGHRTTEKYSVIISVINVLNVSVHTIGHHCRVLYSWPLVSTGLTILFMIVQAPLNFGIIHKVLQENAPGSQWWHIPVCGFCVLMEVANIVVIAQSTTYLHSEWFQGTAPFVFSLTAVFTRRAAELTVVPLSAASKFSSFSLGLGVYFPRLAQSAVINDAGMVISLEVFYAALNIILKVTLYSRHAVLSFLMSGKCKVRGIPRNHRAQGITTISVVHESIFDTTCFIVFSLSRFILLPSTITTTSFALVFCGCISVQVIANAVVFVLVSYVEGIPVDDFSVTWMNFFEFWRRWIYFWSCTMMALFYLTLVTLNLWDSNLRLVVP